MQGADSADEQRECLCPAVQDRYDGTHSVCGWYSMFRAGRLVVEQAGVLVCADSLAACAQLIYRLRALAADAGCQHRRVWTPHLPVTMDQSHLGRGSTYQLLD